MDKNTLDTLKDIVFRHLDPQKYRVFVFGSRATGKAVKFSDVDLGIEGEMGVSKVTLSAIEEAFENSDLPYTVDVVDFNSVTNKFKQIAKQNLILLNQT